MQTLNFDLSIVSFAQNQGIPEDSMLLSPLSIFSIC